jgi:hypothetical protein
LVKAAGVVAAVDDGIRDAEIAHAEPPGELFFLVLEEHQEALVIDFEFFGVPEVVVGLHEVLAATHGLVELAQDQRNLELVLGKGRVQFVRRQAVLFLPLVLEILRNKRTELLEEHVSHGSYPS